MCGGADNLGSAHVMKAYGWIVNEAASFLTSFLRERSNRCSQGSILHYPFGPRMAVNRVLGPIFPVWDSNPCFDAQKGLMHICLFLSSVRETKSGSDHPQHTQSQSNTSSSTNPHPALLTAQRSLTLGNTNRRR